MIDDSFHYRRQQTIKLAIDAKTGELVPAESLLALDESEFTALRRTAMAERLARKHGGTGMRFQCAICKKPLYLSRRREGYANRWFAHADKSEQCPWYEIDRLTPDQTKALIYRGQQEGAHHRALKEFMARWLAQEPYVSEINLEQTTFSEVLRGEWRRPDVKCRFQMKLLVFEIQLSYTFLSDVIARDEFYKREGIFIIWIFARLDLNRAAVTDEAFFNQRNVFVIDTEAIAKTEELGKLIFSGYHQTPSIEEGQIADVWTSQPIGLSEVVFPVDTFRPYFFDYAVARATAEAQIAEIHQCSERNDWNRNIQNYLAAVQRYYETDYANEHKSTILELVEALVMHKLWENCFHPLKEEYFYGWHAVLPVLLSIKLDRPIGYKLKSVYQVIEAGLRVGHRNAGNHAFAIIYLWAYKEYKPSMLEKHRDWIKRYASTVRKSVESGENIYRRFTGYDAAIGLLFPELKRHLTSQFGRVE